MVEGGIAVLTACIAENGRRGADRSSGGETRARRADASGCQSAVLAGACGRISSCTPSSGGFRGVLRAIEDGSWNQTLRTRRTELEASKNELAAQRAALVDPPPVRLLPNSASIYAAKVADLEASLNAPDIRAQASEALRSLIER
jgi:hypothetical protein